MTEDSKKKSLDEKAFLRDGVVRPWYVRCLIWGAGLCIAVGAGYWYYSSMNDAQKVSFVTRSAERGSVAVTVTADGTLNPIRTVTLGSELSGVVRKVNVDVNDTVTAGETLIELDTAKLNASVASAKATLESAQAQLKQANATHYEAQVKYQRLLALNKLSDGKMPSRLELDSQLATVQTEEANIALANAKIADAKAALFTAQTDLAKASIRSPIDGVVLSRSVEPGYAVAASLQAVELLTLATDLSKLELQVAVDEADVGVVRSGLKAYFTVSSYPDRRFPATLKKVAWGATTTENVVTYTAYLDVDNKDMLLRPGMTASATISTAKKDDVLLVPNSALRFEPRLDAGNSASVMSGMMGPPHRSGGNAKTSKDVVEHGQKNRTIYVLREGEPVRVDVLTGLSDGTNTEIVSGNIAAGDQVIVDQRKGSVSK